MSRQTAGMASVYQNDRTTETGSPTEETLFMDYTPQKLIKVSNCNGTYRTTVENGEGTPFLEGQKELQEVRKSLAQIKATLTERKVCNFSDLQCIREWRDVSLVLDRVFFIIYIIVIVTSLGTLFPRPGRQ